MRKKLFYLVTLMHGTSFNHNQYGKIGLTKLTLTQVTRKWTFEHDGKEKSKSIVDHFFKNFDDDIQLIIHNWDYME